MLQEMVQIHEIVHVGGTPVLIYRGRGMLRAVAIVTPVPKADPPLALWMYDEVTVGDQPRAGALYARKLNGKSRVLDVGLGTPYRHGLTAVIMFESRFPESPTQLPTLTFTISFTPEPVDSIVDEGT